MKLFYPLFLVFNLSFILYYIYLFAFIYKCIEILCSTAHMSLFSILQLLALFFIIIHLSSLFPFSLSINQLQIWFTF